MTTNPSISLLMAVYNAAPYLRQAIESVRVQSLSSWELLCVDDGSTDESLAILNEYAASDSRIKVVSGLGNQGPAKARNVALQQATGDFVAMLDADDWLSADALQKVVESFEAHPMADCVLFSLIEEHPGHTCPYKMAFASGDKFTGKEAFRLSLNWKLHGLYAVRRELHLRYPYDDSCKLHSDDNTTRIHYLHSREVHICEGEYHYRKHADSISFAVGMSYFEYLDANLSMKRLLEAELSGNQTETPSLGVEQEDIDIYEAHRWEQYIDKHWFFYLHYDEFGKEEKSLISQKLKDFYLTFTRPYPRKIGFMRFRNYNHFLLQEWLYFRVRKMLGRS